MKNLALFFLLLLNSISAKTQTIEETDQMFREAVQLNKSELVVKYGDEIINYIEKNNELIDSINILYYIHTADAYSTLGDYSKSIEVFEQYICRMDEIQVELDARIYNNLASNYSELGELDARIFNNLALNYSELGDYSAAKKYNEECLKIYERLYGKENQYYARSLNNLALNYSNDGGYFTSKKLSEECLKIYEKVYGKEHPDYAESLDNLAVNYSKLGDYSKAKELNEESLKIRDELFGKEHPDYAKSLYNLANDYSKLGDYSKAKELNEESLKIREKLFGKKHPDYAKSLCNLANNYSELGEYSKAKMLHEECLKIYEKLYSKNHPDYALLLSYLASDYSILGDYSSAKKLNQDCLLIYEKLYGKENKLYAHILSNLASNYNQLGESSTSKKLNEECLKIYEQLFGKKNPYCSAALNNLAGCYYDVGDYSTSKKMHEKCAKMIEELYGIQHRNYAFCLTNLASDYSKLGNYSKAKWLDNESLKIRDKIFGKEHPYYAASLSHLALLYSTHDDYINAYDYYCESFRIGWANYFNNKFGLNQNLQLKTKSKLENSFQYLTLLSLKMGGGINKLNYYWINLNGIIDSDQDKLVDNILSSSDANLIRTFSELKAYKLQLAKWNEMPKFNSFLNEDTDTNTIQVNGILKLTSESIVELVKTIEKLESELSQKSKDFANANRTFELKDVKSNLRKDEVLVDIIRIPGYDFKTNLWTDSVKYLIFFTNASNDTVPQYILINEGAELEDELYSEYSKNKTGLNKENKEIDLTSYKHFWKPIADKIADYKTVYISLGGIYNNINLNALYNPETGKYLLEEKNIRIVNSARDFVLNKESEKKIYTTNTASLFGFPDFNGNTNISSDSMDFFAATRDLSAFWLDSLTRGGLKVNPLPATKIEVENISLTLKSKGWQVNSFLADNASEMNMKKQENPRILHIATHGYFFLDVPLEKENSRFLGMDRQQVIQDPMLRSGLLFTGANRTLKGEELKGENGLLSAAEASLLDLRETELVVLSACETGKGEVKNSEGVYGLRKAFSDAGAKNIIMSLWKVDDKVTQEFMSRFYEIWLNDKTTIREAFNKTQLEIKAKYPEPYYWGAFILVGE